MSFLPSEFLERFAIPLVSGGALHVSRPLDADDLAALAAEQQSPGDAVVRLEALRGRHAEHLWLFPLSTALDARELQLLVGLHNLLFLSHPALDRRFITGGQLRRMIAFTERCLRQPPLSRPEELIVRHTMLANIGRISRVDTEVRFWVGRRVFHGQTPPARLLRWAGLRRVRHEQTTVSWPPETDEAPEDRRDDLVQLLFAQSPLSDLLSPARRAPPLRLEDVARLLRDARLCRTICYDLLEQGLAAVGPGIAAAYWRLVERVIGGHPPVEDAARRRRALSLVAAMVQHIYALSCLAAEPPPERWSDPRAALCGVLVAARRAGVVPDPAEQVDRWTANRLEQLVAGAERRLGDAAGELVERLALAATTPAAAVTARADGDDASATAGA